MSEMKTQLFNQLKYGIIVSCQAEGEDPFNFPEGVSLFAKAAEMGGAVGIRSEGVAKTKAIIQSVELPVIGLVKRAFPDGYVCITRTMEDVKNLYEIGCSIVAIDGTDRQFENRTGPKLIEKVKSEMPGSVVMADIATVKDAEHCVSAGADCLSTTLSGYTPETGGKKTDLPDLQLVEELSNQFQLPVFAEGRYNTPELARRAIESGAWAVVAGTAITRPRVITQWFANAIQSAGK